MITNGKQSINASSIGSRNSLLICPTAPINSCCPTSQPYLCDRLLSHIYLLIPLFDQESFEIAIKVAETGKKSESKLKIERLVRIGKDYPHALEEAAKILRERFKKGNIEEMVGVRDIFAIVDAGGDPTLLELAQADVIDYIKFWSQRRTGPSAQDARELISHYLKRGERAKVDAFIEAISKLGSTTGHLVGNLTDFLRRYKLQDQAEVKPDRPEDEAVLRLSQEVQRHGLTTIATAQKEADASLNYLDRDHKRLVIVKVLKGLAVRRYNNPEEALTTQK